jgi:hypothetical protein
MMSTSILKYISLFFISVSANYLTKIGPTGLRAHECRCWANHSTITAELAVTLDTGGYRAESTTSWSVLEDSQPLFIMSWCKYPSTASIWWKILSRSRKTCQIGKTFKSTTSPTATYLNRDCETNCWVISEIPSATFLRWPKYAVLTTSLGNSPAYNLHFRSPSLRSLWSSTSCKRGKHERTLKKFLSTKRKKGAENSRQTSFPPSRALSSPKVL